VETVFMSDPVLIDIASMKPKFGWAKTFTYELLKNHKIKARKVGRRTFIEVQSVRDYIASLPTYGEAA
jgi:hypothetical protein